MIASNEIGGSGKSVRTSVYVDGGTVGALTITLSAGTAASSRRRRPPRPTPSRSRQTSRQASASPSTRIFVLALGGGGAGTASLAASVAINSSGAETEAYVGGGAHVGATSGNVQILAFDDSTITSIAGAGSGAGTVAGAAAISTNDIGNVVRADVRGAGTQVSATGGFVRLQADSDATINVFAISGGGAGTFAGTGAVAVNSISNTVEAFVSGGARVDSTSSISLSATDESTISAA